MDVRLLCFGWRNNAQCSLILLDALLRREGGTGMFEYGERNGIGRFRSKKPFKQSFGFDVRIASHECAREQLGWF